MRVARSAEKFGSGSYEFPALCLENGWQQLEQTDQVSLARSILMGALPHDAVSGSRFLPEGA